MKTPSDLPEIPSPCIGVCRLDRETRRCVGCMRTTREIAEWPGASNARRLEIVGDLRERRRSAGRVSEADRRPRRRRRSNETTQGATVAKEEP